MSLFKHIFQRSFKNMSNYKTQQYYLKLDRNIRDYIEFLDTSYTHIQGVFHNPLSERDELYIEARLEMMKEISTKLKKIILVDFNFRIK